VAQPLGMSRPVGRYSTSTTRASRARWSTSSRSADVASAKTGSRPDAPTSRGNVINLSRSTRPRTEKLSSNRQASHRAERDIAVALEPTDLSDEIVTTNARVRPRHRLQGCRKHHLGQLGCPVPGGITCLLRETRKGLVGASPKDNQLRQGQRGSDPL